MGNGTYWGSAWNTYNSYNPFIPAGITAPLGNNTGIVDYQCLQSDGTYQTFHVASYRGWEQPQQYLNEHNDDVLVHADQTAGEVLLYLCSDTSKFTTPSDSAASVPNGYEELGKLPSNTADGFISAMGIGRGYSFPSSIVGGAGNKNYCDYYWHPTGDGWYQLLSAAGAATAEAAGVRSALAHLRGAYADAVCGFPLCLDISNEGI